MIRPFVDRRPLADRWVFRLGVRVHLVEGALWLSWFVRIDGTNWVLQAILLSLLTLAGMECGMRMSRAWRAHHSHWHQVQAPLPLETLSNVWGWGNTWLLVGWWIWINGTWHLNVRFWLTCLVAWNLLVVMAWLGVGWSAPRPIKKIYY